MSYAHLFTGAPAPDDGQTAPPERFRILLVDDEPNVLSALKRGTPSSLSSAIT